MEAQAQQEVKVEEPAISEEIPKSRCSRCKKEMTPELKKGKVLKTCNVCREVRNQKRVAKVVDKTLEQPVGKARPVRPAIKAADIDHVEVTEPPKLERQVGHYKEIDDLPELDDIPEDVEDVSEEELSNFINIVRIINDGAEADQLFRSEEELLSLFKTWILAKFNPVILKK